MTATRVRSIADLLAGPEPTKACATCRKVKVVSLFYGHSKNADGLMGSCKRCTRERQDRRRCQGDEARI